MKYDKLVVKFGNLSFKCFSEFMQHPYYLLLAKMWSMQSKHTVYCIDTTEIEAIISQIEMNPKLN